MLKRITDREEDYLKAIFVLAHGTQTPVSPRSLVARLSVSSAAVSRMTQRLDQTGLVHRMAYQGVSLTTEGRQHALRVLRFHRLMEVFLVQELGYDWADVDKMVEKLEHAIDEEMANRLEIYLDFPTTCPHGDPIPSQTLELDSVRERPLTTLAVGQHAVINRVTGDSAMFRHLKEQDLIPGIRLVLKQRVKMSGLLLIQRDDELLPIAPLVAGAIFVRRPADNHRSL